ncbi:hypothetical protein G4G28_14205 [Massilia sp. Dwa41.01b]|uniref:hypothetical protein n=1 Tax=unclassified Massilia TaxID=2609279 RepID=UPI0015FEF109|nr:MULTISPECIES: hypothetical protein [unclassified Massilia]QNA89338.1 hypothetical protein G4G28_14205 [Massilia sp. Dwa41.01b]QNB00234.1 hypothetical protein G4G31_17775 [Massilia sp. Se16.2.3]
MHIENSKRAKNIAHVLREAILRIEMERLLKMMLLCMFGVSSSAWSATRRMETCEQIRAFALGNEGSRSVALNLETLAGNKSKSCRALPADAIGMKLCAYLSTHTSSETLAPNISEVVHCLTGRPLPFENNVITRAMHGEFIVVEPFNSSTAEVEFKYFFNQRPGEAQGFVLTVAPAK